MDGVQDHVGGHEAHPDAFAHIGQGLAGLAGPRQGFAVGQKGSGQSDEFHRIRGRPKEDLGPKEPAVDLQGRGQGARGMGGHLLALVFFCQVDDELDQKGRIEAVGGIGVPPLGLAAGKVATLGGELFVHIGFQLEQIIVSGLHPAGFPGVQLIHELDAKDPVGPLLHGGKDRDPVRGQVVDPGKFLGGHNGVGHQGPSLDALHGPNQALGGGGCRGPGLGARLGGEGNGLLQALAAHEGPPGVGGNLMVLGGQGGEALEGIGVLPGKIGDFIGFQGDAPGIGPDLPVGVHIGGIHHGKADPIPEADNALGIQDHPDALGRLVTIHAGLDGGITDLHEPGKLLLQGQDSFLPGGRSLRAGPLGQAFGGGSEDRVLHDEVLGALLFHPIPGL